MKYITGGIVAAAAIIGIVVWLRGAPQDSTSMVEPTSAPEMTEPTTPPETGGQTSSANTSANQGKKSAFTTITTKDGMKIETTMEGSGTAIANGQTAVVEYTGKLTDGTVFDSTDKHGGTPFSFTLGAGQVIKGWDEGVAGMKVGEMRTLTIPSDLAYGASGIPGVIPGGATLVFDVKLVGIK